MDAASFAPDAPGRLVETSGQEWRHTAAGKRELAEFRGEAFVPDPLPPRNLDFERLIGRIWPELGAATAALQRLDATAATLTNPHLLSNPFKIREAQASSRIENTIASAEEVAIAGAGGPTADEPREVQNYLLALDEGLASEAPLGEWLLRQLHHRLLEGVRGGDRNPGELRKGQAYIQGDERGFRNARFVPPPATEVQACMRDLQSFLDAPPEAIPPLVQVALVHYQFETIHPFADGNGRLGRILISLSMCRMGLISRPLLSISSYFDRHRQTYYDLLLGVSQRGEWEPWVRFFCDAVAVQAEDGARRGRKLLELRRSWLEKVTTPRAPALLREAVDRLFERPAVSAKSMAERLNVRPQQAQRYIDRLRSLGILREVTGGQYGRIYVADEIVAAIEADDVE